MDDDPLDAAQTLDLAIAALGEPLTGGVPLGGSARSLVLRATRADGSTVIVKRFAREDQWLPGASGHQREQTGLELLSRTPSLLATDPDSNVLVMSDVGEHPTLADHLRGDDPDLAWSSAMTWARGLGELVASSVPVLEEAAARLGVSSETTEASAVLVQDRVTTGVTRLAEVAGVDVGADVLDELAAAYKRARGGPLVLSPGDTCPDNVLLTPDGPVFVDLEGTDVHPIALDEVYARLPFATCWCVYAQPPGFTDAMSQAFADGVRAVAPDLIGPEWDEDAIAVAAVFVLWLEGLMIERADTEPDRRMGPTEKPSSTFREVTQLRLDWLRDEAADVLPHTAAFAGRVVAALRERWGASVPPLYPAWSGCC